MNILKKSLTSILLSTLAFTATPVMAESSKTEVTITQQQIDDYSSTGKPIPLDVSPTSISSEPSDYKNGYPEATTYTITSPSEAAVMIPVNPVDGKYENQTTVAVINKKGVWSPIAKSFIYPNVSGPNYNDKDQKYVKFIIPDGTSQIKIVNNWYDFTDVANYSYSIKEVYNAVAARGIMTGLEPYTVFGPASKLDRAQTAAILYRYAGSPSVDGLSAPYPDVVKGAWYENAAIWAYNVGIITGYANGTFAPSAPINREQFYTMLYRTSGSPVAFDGSLLSQELKDQIASWAWAGIEFGMFIGYDREPSKELLLEQLDRDYTSHIIRSWLFNYVQDFDFN